MTRAAAGAKRRLLSAEAAIDEMLDADPRALVRELQRALEGSEFVAKAAKKFGWVVRLALEKGPLDLGGRVVQNAEVVEEMEHIHAVPNAKLQALRKAIDHVRATTDPRSRALDFLQLAAHLPGEERELILSEAVEAARKITDAGHRTYFIRYSIWLIETGGERNLNLVSYRSLYNLVRSEPIGAPDQGHQASEAQDLSETDLNKRAEFHALADEAFRGGLSIERFRKAIESELAAMGRADVAREMTARTKKKPRLKWERNRLADENPAAFAWRAYQSEAQDGTLHRGIIAKEDKPLAIKLANWLRTHAMPDGIDIPTQPEWNTRQLSNLGDDPHAHEVLRLGTVARRRRERAATQG